MSDRLKQLEYCSSGIIVFPVLTNGYGALPGKFQTAEETLIAPFYPTTKAPVTTGNSPVIPSTLFKVHHKGDLDQLSCSLHCPLP